MITILHGDDISSSRKYFLDLKQKTKSSFSVDGTKTTVTEITQILEGGDLFSEHKDLFIEELLSKRKKSKELDEIIKLISENSKDSDIYIWENKELTKPQQFTFKNASLKSFKYPQTLFAFLDNIKPGNGKNLVKLFHETLKKTESEIIFHMIVRQFRLLIACHPEPRLNRGEGSQPPKTDSSLSAQNDNPIDEIKRMASWQLGKLEKQSKLFSIDQLTNIYNKLFEIDLSQKTGSSPLSLEQSIDMMLLNI